MKNKPSVSVIIPAYNEEKRIGSCLRALKNQNVSIPYEIILVDNNSTDETYRIARTYNIRVIKKKRKGNVYALRRGVQEARAPILLLTDADTIVPPFWIHEYVSFFSKNPDAVAAAGPFIYTDGHPLVRWYTQFFHYIFPRMLVRTTIGMNMGFRRKAYERVGGFDPSVNLQGDSHLGHKLQSVGKIGFLKRNTVYTSGRRFYSLSALMRESYIRSVNYFSLIIFKKPSMFVFEDIR